MGRVLIRGKDRSAGETIQTAQGILDNLGLEIKQHWVNSFNNEACSVRLTLNGTDVGTNGKGLCRHAALASALGEWMERLQNELLLRPWHTLGPSQQRTFHPDAVRVRADDFETAELDVIKVLFSHSRTLEDGPTDLAAFMGLLRRFDASGPSDGILCLPYFSVAHHKCLRIPYAVRVATGSNGMCAGNTSAEALVQGLCEICERTAYLRTLTGRTLLADISDKHIRERFPDLHWRTRSLMASPGLEIVFKQAIEAHVPTYCCLVRNTLNRTYALAFGGHPCPEVALSRAFTEALQGKTIDRLPNASDAQRDVVNSLTNWLSLVTLGIGVHPPSFLERVTPVTSSSPQSDTHRLSNRGLLQDLLQRLTDEKRFVLIRNVGYLGFPAFHVVIPGMSELSPVSRETCVRHQASVMVHNLLLEMATCTQSQLETVIEYGDFLLRRVDRRRTLCSLCPSLGMNFPDYPYDLRLFVVLGLWYAGDEDRALASAEQMSQQAPVAENDAPVFEEVLRSLRRRNHRSQWIAFFRERFLKRMNARHVLKHPEEYPGFSVNRVQRILARRAMAHFPQQTGEEIGL